MSSYPQTLWLPPANPYAIEDVYQTPMGYRDFPFMYVYDANQLTSGNNYLSQRVLMDGSADFILRFIWGFSQVLILGGGAKFQLKNYWGSYCSSKPMIMNADGSAVISPGTGILKNPDTWQVIPEKRYPLDGQITFDLYNVNPAANGLAFLGFTGVKRRQQNYCYYDTPYKYKELPYSYDAPFTLNTTEADANGNQNGPIQLQINIADYDFELQRILVCADRIVPLQFSMTIYDNGGEATSNKPIPYGYLTDNGLGEGGSGFNVTWNPTGMVFPTPPLVYQNQGRLRYDIWSNTSLGLPLNVHLVFQGVQRLPCG